MSIYIKGDAFYKPTGCAPCKIRNWCQLWRQVDLPAHIVHPECPISEVSEHGRLIDADKALADNEDYYSQLGRPDGVVGASYRSVLRSIILAPTIIPSDQEGKR